MAMTAWKVWSYETALNGGIISGPHIDMNKQG